MKYPFYSGLSGKTAIIFLVAFVAIILPVNLIVYAKVKATIVATDTRQMLTEAEKLAAQTRLDPIIVPLPPAGNTIAVRQLRDGMFTSIFESPDFPNLESSWLVNETFELDTLKLIVQKVGQPDGSELWFILARSNQPLQHQLSEIKLYLFYVTGIVVLIVALLVFALCGLMFRPLKKLVAAASDVQASEKMQRLPVPTTKDEAQVLALALNDMIARIETSINQQAKFFDSATHELKTPLSILRAEISKAQTSIQDIKTKDWIAALLLDVERLERTIADFLLSSQLKNRTLTLRKEPASLPEIVFYVLKKFRKLADERGLKISLTQSDSADRICLFDKDKTQTIVFNLIENAVWYSPDGTTVTIFLEQTNDSCSFIITNSLTASITSADQLGNHRYADSARGMGLGLWICRQLTELHNGKLELTATERAFKARLILSAADIA